MIALAALFCVFFLILTSRIIRYPCHLKQKHSRLDTVWFNKTLANFNCSLPTNKTSHSFEGTDTQRNFFRNIIDITPFRFLSIVKPRDSEPETPLMRLLSINTSKSRLP